MSIFDLPLEIQDMILDLEPQEALLALRATCSTALSQINPRVFSTVQLNYDLIEALANNLCTFTSSVKKICWKYDLDEAGTPQLFQYWSQLSHLPALKQLEIEVIGDQDELSFTEFPPLRMFHDLESLSVTFPGDLLTAYSEREIAVAISRSSNLRNLQILNLTDTPFFSDVKQCISLSAFLSSPVTALEKLQIHHVPFPRRGLRQVISSSLRELSVLTRNGGRGIKSNWGALWSTLGVSGARLSSLKVSGSEAAMDELFAYLTSYTGLRLLEISDIVMDGQEMEDCAGEKFWGEVVPHHYATLATLSVTPKYGGSWCYGPAAAASLRKCFSLRYLTISLGEINPSWARDQVHALQADGVTFSGAVELDEAPNSYVALIICGLSVPLVQLDLNLVQKASDRASYLAGLERPRRPLDSGRAFVAFQQYRLLRSKAQEMVLGIRAPDVVATKWPWVVAIIQSERRSRHRSGEGIWYYKSE